MQGTMSEGLGCLFASQFSFEVTMALLVGGATVCMTVLDLVVPMIIASGVFLLVAFLFWPRKCRACILYPRRRRSRAETGDL
ncbi:MAG: hypothetical protein AAF358_19860 [Pseudomonadota bacterium]